MSTTYTLIAQDDFDWNYVGTSKQQKITEFIEKVSEHAHIKLVAQWYGFAVFNIERAGVIYEPLFSIVKVFCDSAHYYVNTTPYDLVKLDSEPASMIISK